MRRFTLVRTAVLAASLIANINSIGVAFASSANAQLSNTSPYDSPDFVVPPADIHS
jgi:hypothetical protein